MSNDMLEKEQLSHLPGAPFTEDETDGAVSTLRRAIGWHIAPEKSETIELECHDYSQRLWLPTARIAEVSEIRDKATGTVIPATGYQVKKALSTVKRIGAYWPSTVEVDLTHGYEEVPADLLTVIGAIAATMRRDQTVRQAIAGTYVLPLVGIDNVVYRYVPWWTRVAGVA